MPASPPDGVAGEALALWEDIVARYDPSPAELAVARELVRTIAEAERMEARLRAEGYTVTSPSGVEKAHPLAPVVRTHRLVASRLLRELGLLREDDQPGRRPGRPGRSL